MTKSTVHQGDHSALVDSINSVSNGQADTVSKNSESKVITITVSGTVSDLTGKPLSKVQVTNLTNIDIPRVYSDINGKYTIPNIKEGDELYFKSESTMSDRLLKVGKSTLLNATLDKLELTDIHGNIADIRGNPLENVTITIRFSNPKRFTTSDTYGNYTLPNVRDLDFLDTNYKGRASSWFRYHAGQPIFNLKLDLVK
jgi:hypothetical protein